MKVTDLAGALGMKIVHPGKEDAEVTTGYASDLLSDVMANAEDGCALITIQSHVNTVAVSSLAGVSAIIICGNHPIPSDMEEAAKREGVALLQTEHNQFVTSHLVYCKLSGTTP